MKAIFVSFGKYNLNNILTKLKICTLRPVNDATEGRTQEAPMGACFVEKLAKNGQKWL